MDGKFIWIAIKDKVILINALKLFEYVFLRESDGLILCNEIKRNQKVCRKD